MSVTVICRGCGRRVQLPAEINPHKARCPKCRTKLAPDGQVTPDTFPTVPEEHRPDTGAKPRRPAPTAAPARVPPRPPGEVLSLDDDGPEPISAGPRPNPVHPKPAPPPAAPDELPPPFRFAVRVTVDSRKQLRGTMSAVLTPYGLFLEKVPNKPLVSVPLGTKVEATGPVVALALPDRALTLRFGGVDQPAALAADTAAFLAGERPVPLPPDYRRPWWLLGVGAVLALGLAAGPVVFAQVADLGLGVGLVFGAIFAALVTAANGGIAFLLRLPVPGKIALMAGVGGTALVVFLFAAMAYFAGRKELAEHAADPTPPADQPSEPPPDQTPGPGPRPGPASSPGVEPQRPPTHFDVVYRDGKTRLDDGPADVTALAVSPTDGAVVIGYADGSTRVWPLDQPTFEPPRVGPHATSAVRRIEFDASGRLAFLTCDTGLVVGSATAPRRLPLVIPGELGTILSESNRSRFAIVRAGGRVQVRHTPLELAANPPPGQAAKGFVLTTPKDEGIPLGGRPDVAPPGGKPTFLAWHPTGRLLCGGPDGSVVTLPTPGVSAVTSKVHRTAVRAWATSPWGDFATGDDDGFVGYWPNKTTTPTKFRTGGVAIRHLAYSPCGGELVVADAVGAVSIWDPITGTRVCEVKRRTAVAAVAFGPQDDLLMMADGKGVGVWWIPELVAPGGG